MGKVIEVKDKLREVVRVVELNKAYRSYRGVGAMLYNMYMGFLENKPKEIVVDCKTYVIVKLVNSDHFTLIRKADVLKSIRLTITVDKCHIGIVVGTSGANVKESSKVLKSLYPSCKLRYINVKASLVDIHSYTARDMLSAIMTHLEYTKDNIVLKCTINDNPYTITNEGIVGIHDTITYDDICEDWDILDEMEFEDIIDTKTNEPFMVTEL